MNFFSFSPTLSESPEAPGSLETLAGIRFSPPKPKEVKSVFSSLFDNQPSTSSLPSTFSASSAFSSSSSSPFFVAKELETISSSLYSTSNPDVENSHSSFDTILIEKDMLSSNQISTSSLPLTFSTSSALSPSSSSATVTAKDLDNVSTSSSRSDVYSPTVIMFENQSSNSVSQQKYANLDVEHSLSSLDTILLERDKVFSSPFASGQHQITHQPSGLSSHIPSTPSFYDSESIRGSIDTNNSDLTLTPSCSLWYVSSLSSSSSSASLSPSLLSTICQRLDSEKSNSTSCPSLQILSPTLSSPSLSHAQSLPDISLPLSQSFVSLPLSLPTYMQPATVYGSGNGGSTGVVDSNCNDRSNNM